MQVHPGGGRGGRPAGSQFEKNLKGRWSPFGWVGRPAVNWRKLTRDVLQLGTNGYGRSSTVIGSAVIAGRQSKMEVHRL